MIKKRTIRRFTPTEAEIAAPIFIEVQGQNCVAEEGYLP